MPNGTELNHTPALTGKSEGRTHTRSFKARWGHERERIATHPRRAARQQRALLRQAEEAQRPVSDPRLKAVRLARARSQS